MNKKRVWAALSTCLCAGALMTSSLGGVVAETQNPAGGSSVIVRDFDESLGQALVERNNYSSSGSAERKDGVLSLTPEGTWSWVYTKNLNKAAFTAAEDVEIRFDYTLLAYEWAPLFRICVGGDAADKQWGSIMLGLEGVGDGKTDLLCQTDGETVVKTAADVLQAGVLYHVRITVGKATGTLSVWLTKDGMSEAAEPTLKVTDAEYTEKDSSKSIATLSGGVNFGAQFKPSTLDNLVIKAGDRVLVNDDFSERDLDLTHESSEAESYAVIADGVLKVYGWDAAHATGKTVISKGLFGRSDLDSYRLSVDYTPEDTAWVDDKLILGYQGNGTAQHALSLAFSGTGAEKSVTLQWNDGTAIRKLDSKELTLESGRTYHIEVTTDAESGSVHAAVMPDGGEAVTLSAEDEALKALKGDIGVSSWAGNYTVDNLRVERTETSGTTTTTSEVPETTTTTEGNTTTTTGKRVVTDTVILDFDSSLKVANVGLDKQCKESDGTVKEENGKLHLVCGNRGSIWSQVVNANAFTAEQDVEISLDYCSANRAWAGDVICIGAKGDRQWGGLVLELLSTEGSTRTIKLKNDMLEELAVAGDEPLAADTQYRIRILLKKSSGEIQVYIDAPGETSQTPVLSEKNEAVKTLSGGVAFGGWASDYTVDNLKIVAGGKTLMDADFSTQATDIGHPDNREEGTALISGGVLNMNGWNQAHTGGNVAITRGLFGTKELTDLDLSLEYTPSDVRWSFDKILLGYGDNASEQNTLILEMRGETQKMVLKKVVGDQITELAETDLTLTAGKTYFVEIALDTAAGTAAVTVTPDGGAAVSLSVSDEFIRTLKGDIGLVSWGGQYTVDNVKLVSYGTELPHPIDTGAALPTAALLLCAAAAAAVYVLKARKEQA